MPKHDDSTSTDTSEIEALIARLEAGRLREDDVKTLARLLRTFLALIHLLQRKNSSIARLKRLLFGPRSDTRSTTANKPESQPATDSATDSATDEAAMRIEQTTSSDTTSSGACDTMAKPKQPGHGRLPAAAYTGARVEHCVDPQLKAGAACPDAACTGRLYDTRSPAVLIRLEGQPIVGATRYEQEVLRCSSCQERFTAPLPEGVPPQKYSATADVAVVMAKYAGGIPAYRLTRLQQSCGIPLPESVQSEQSERVANSTLPIFIEVVKAAARG